jgi:hypothetical protein
MTNEFFSMVKPAIDDTRRQLRDGSVDIRDIQSMIRGQREYYQNPSNKSPGDQYFDEWKKYYDIYADRVTSYGQKLCNTDARKPNIQL